MAKKIYDIVPPNVRKKAAAKKSSAKPEKKYVRVVRQKPVEAEVMGAFQKPQKEAHVRQPKEANFSWFKVLAGTVGVLVLAAAVFLYFKLQKADIEIWPKTEVLSFNQKVEANKLADNAVLVEVIQDEKDLWQAFEATGKTSANSKATGTITVYTTYSPASAVTLKAGTHFLSDSVKYFVTLAKIVVPAAKKSGSKTVPGSISVKVQAQDAGSEYNIGPAKFSVPKLAGTDYYYSVYASSSDSMVGGSAKSVKQVTDDDIQGAKDTLTQKLIDSLKESIKSKMTPDDILLDNAISTNVIDASSAVKAGATVDSFNYQAKVGATALVVKKSDLKKVSKDYIFSQIPSEKTILSTLKSSQRGEKEKCVVTSASIDERKGKTN